jgi:hypothetical protein
VRRCSVRRWLANGVARSRPCNSAEHAYERNYPVGPEFAWNASRTGPSAYVNADRPIHILTGAAGCPEDEDAWQAKGNPFSALRINDYGACVWGAAP